MLDPQKGVGIFTDGSSHHVDMSGGWAFICFDAFGNEETGHGWASNTTNNRMEMEAWVQGLRHVFETYGPCDVLLFSDSQYIVRGVSDPLRKRNFNRDLWFDIEDAIEKHTYVESNWVRGHDESHWNNVVDELAKQARKEGLDELQSP